MELVTNVTQQLCNDRLNELNEVMEVVHYISRSSYPEKNIDPGKIVFWSGYIDTQALTKEIISMNFHVSLIFKYTDHKEQN